MTPRRNAGFTLLEVMVAMAILGGSLVWFSVAVSRNLTMENHAKLMTTATFLARQKMIDMEDQLYDQGFGEFEKEVTGTFEDLGFPRFSFSVIVDKIELPSVDQVQQALQKTQEAQAAALNGQTPTTPTTPPPGASTDPNATQQTPFGMGASVLSSQFTLIKSVLEQGIRRVNIRVTWYEGQRPQEVAVMAYYTDPRQVDTAIQIPSGGTGSGSGSAKTTTTTGSGH